MTSKSSDPKQGLALWLSFLVIPILLYFQSNYFMSWTNGISVMFIFMGVSGLGMILDQLNNPQLSVDLRKMHSNTFTSLGIGVAFLVLWIYLNQITSTIWMRSASFFVLVLALYGIVLGIVNILFGILFRDTPSKDTSTHRDNTSSTSLPFDEAKNWSRVQRLFAWIGGFITITAAILQSLQILKVIP